MELSRAKGQFPMEKRWAWLLVLISALLVVAIISSNISIISSFRTMFVVVHAAPAAAPPSPAPPRLAYLISGSKGDLDRLWRTLRAMYHPHNLYVVHLDLESPAGERRELSARVAGDAVFSAVGNVRVIEKANMVTYRGPTMVANTLHACAILLKMEKNWDWFINLSASDYPLTTQDDILHAFSSLPRNISFMEHTSRLGWKELV
ncbi:beta-glucuronosyltransferase GlcAT14A-like [Curcuma longa]|uniref:beta-glucuronosyltransferase GlcAT14A-like n=1 Tax=Curcuma longa TaxID=136217 RepID=UPI003D9DDB5B